MNPPYKYGDPTWCEFCQSYDCPLPIYWGSGVPPFSLLDRLTYDTFHIANRYLPELSRLLHPAEEAEDK